MDNCNEIELRSLDESIDYEMDDDERTTSLVDCHHHNQQQQHHRHHQDGDNQRRQHVEGTASVNLGAIMIEPSHIDRQYAIPASTAESMMMMMTSTNSHTQFPFRKRLSSLSSTHGAAIGSPLMSNRARQRRQQLSMKCFCSQCFRLLNIRNVLMILFLIHAVITIGCSWLLLYNAGQSTIHSSRRIEQDQIFKNVQNGVAHFMNWGPLVLKTVITNVKQGRVNRYDHLSLGQFFYGTKKAFGDAISILYYGTEKDDFIMVSSLDEIGIQNETHPGRLISYETDSDGNAISIVKTGASFSISSRPWYHKAELLGRDTWSDVFMSLGALNQTKVLSIAFCSPHYFPNGTLEGVFATQLPLHTISKHLNDTLWNLPTADAFVMNSDGILLASSNIQLMNEYIGMNATMTTGIVRSVALALQRRKRLNESNLTYNGQVSYQSSTYYFGAASYSLPLGLDWTLVVVVKHKSFWSVIFSSSVAIVIISFVSIFLGTIAVLVVTQAITIPLYQVQKKLLNLSHFNTKEGRQRIMRSPFFEIRAIQDSMSVLTHTLQSFQHYVPEIVLNTILSEKTTSKLGMQERNSISIMFADLVDFTQLSEIHAQRPERLLEVIGEFFEEMSTIIENDMGLVDKYIGDCIMALWMDETKHALYACQAACDCQIKMRELRSSWRERGLPELKIRIGINSGRALVGNCGSSRRLNYTALGDSVNLAARIEPLNKDFDTNILIGESTYMLVKDVFLCEYVAFVAVKGRDKPLKVYRLVCIRQDATPEMLAIQEQLLSVHDAFFSYSFKQAIECCKEVKSLVSQIHTSEGSYDLSYTFVDQIIHAAQDCLERGVNPPQPISVFLRPK